MFRKIGLIAAIDGTLKGIGFLLLPVYLNLMSKNEFGEFTYYFVAVSFLIPLISLSLYIPQIREFSSTEDEEEKNRVFSSTINLTVTIFVMLAVFFMLTNFHEIMFQLVFGDQANSDLKALVLFSMIGFGAINLILYSHCIAQKKTKLIVIFNCGKFVCVTSLGLSILYIGTGYEDSSLDRMMGMLVGEILTTIIMFVYMGRSYYLWSVDTNYLRKAARISLPMLPASIANFVANMSDRYFLNLYHDAGAIAEYNLAFQILFPIQMIMVATQTAWAPYLFSVKDDKEAHRQTRKFLLKVTVVFVLLVFLLWGMTVLLMQARLIPEQYVDVDSLLPLMAISVIGSALIQLPYNLFIRNGRTSIVAYIAGVKAILIVLVGFLIIEKYGYYGAAIGQGVVLILVLFVTLYLAKKYNQKVI